MGKTNEPRKGTTVSKVVDLARQGLTPKRIAKELDMPYVTTMSNLNYARSRGYLPYPVKELKGDEVEKGFRNYLTKVGVNISSIIPAAIRAMDIDAWKKVVDRAAAEGYPSMADYAMDLMLEDALNDDRAPDADTPEEQDQ